MKRIILFLIVVFTLAGVAALTARPAVRILAQKKLGAVFPGAAVSIGDCRLDPLRGLSFLDIRLKRDHLYDIKVGEIGFRYSLSSLFHKRLEEVALKVTSLQSGKIFIKEGFLKAGRHPEENEFSVGVVKYDKARIENLRGSPQWEGQELTLRSLSAGAYGGKIGGDVLVKAGRVPEYKADLTFKGIGFERLLKDLELAEKFQMTGAVSGSLVIGGRGTDLDILSGDFAMDASGGMLTVKDTRFLERMAQRTNQPLDILVESFKQYHYNSGNVVLSLGRKNVLLDMALEGETGKRNLNITLHDVMQERSSAKISGGRTSSFPSKGKTEK